MEEREGKLFKAPAIAFAPFSLILLCDKFKFSF